MSNLSEEQAELARVVRSFLTKVCDSSKRRETIASTDGYDHDTWSLMAEQIGLQGLGAPSEVGGSGAGAVELCVTLEELGRALVPTPYYSTGVRAVTLLGALPAGDARDTLLTAVTEGKSVVAVVDGRQRNDAANLIEVTHDQAEGWRVSGTAALIPDIMQADVLLIVASRPDDSRAALLALETDQSGVRRSDLDTFDTTRRLGTVILEQAAATLIDGSNADQAAAREESVATLGLAAESVGVAAAALDIAVEYAKTREQFGRSIGSFQALKHMLADAKFNVETSRAAVQHAAAQLDQDPTEKLRVYSTAAYVTEATYQTTAIMLQVLGGIGFTQEHDAHLFYKRAVSNRQMLGGSDALLDRVAGLVIDERAMAEDIAMRHDSTPDPGETTRPPWSSPMESFA